MKLVTMKDVRYTTLQAKFSLLSPKINYLTKMDKNKKFKMAAAAILNFFYRS